MKTVMMAIVIICLYLTAAAGPIYRWVDEQGQVHYGDRPPPGGAKRIEAQPAPASGPSQFEAQRANRELERHFDQSIREHQTARDLAPATASRPSGPSWYCTSLRRDLEDAQDRLRHGYSASEGDYLHKRVDRLEEDIARECR